MANAHRALAGRVQQLEEGTGSSHKQLAEHAQEQGAATIKLAARVADVEEAVVNQVGLCVVGCTSITLACSFVFKHAFIFQ